LHDEEVTRLRRAVAKLTRALNTSATSEGLTPTQASVLGLVAARGPLALSTLVEAEHLNPTMLSRVIGKLDEVGLVRRTPGVADQRTVRAEVTAEGRRVHKRIRNSRNTIVSGCVAQLPAEQSAALTGAIPALEALAGELTKL
jgi:DNA-binding MarR family transcriptional regulator